MDKTLAITLAKKLAQQFATRADEADINNALPAEDVQDLQNSGYLILSIPRDYGGFGLCLRDCLAAHLELAQGSGSTALVAGMQIHLFGHQNEIQSWPAGAFERVCQLAVGGGLLNTLASEPALGSPSRGGLPSTEARHTKAGWLLNGHKAWATGGQHLTHMLVTCRIEDDSALVLVQQNTPGIKWQETWHDALSLRASDSHDVDFQDVLVPHDHLITRGKNGKPPVNAWFSMLIATTYLGEAIAARNTVIRFALERVPTALGKPIATLPNIQRQIGEIDLVLQAARALLFEVAAEWTGRAEVSIGPISTYCGRQNLRRSGGQ
jgi:alkylation response protein AidB-like acyl-CoA dehydrogenase